MSDKIVLAKLIESISFSGDDRVLLFFSEPRGIVNWIAARVAAVTIGEVDFALWKRLQDDPHQPANIQAVDITRLDEMESFTKVIIDSPKGRSFARSTLWRAYLCLQQGGQVYLVGANDEGIKSVIADAETLYGSASVLAYKKGHRLGVATKTQVSRAFPAEWGDLPTHWQPKPFSTPLGDIVVAALPGVFSWSELDAGTEFLLSQSHLQQAAAGAVVLDVGCGNGVIGGLLARLAESVQMVDVNLLAVMAANSTIQLNNLANARAYPSDVYSEVAPVLFDLIVSNPPFHKGFDLSKDVTHRIIAEANPYLQPGGELVIVANVFLPYEDQMRSSFDGVQVLASSQSYKILVGKKR